MSTTISTTPTTARPVWSAAARSGALAAAATVSVAALANVAGMSIDVGGEPIPVAGFATVTIAAVVIGYVLAIGLNRWASRPRHTFTAAAVLLTVASFIPDLTFPMSLETRVLLIGTHLLAAFIVIPSIAGRLRESR